MAITDKAMQAKPAAADQWLTQAFMRGGGVFVGRITPTGERLFYFRYTDSSGRRPFLPIGPYHPKGSNGLTLAQAYNKAAELSAMYRSGIKDLREHFAQSEADRRAVRDLERQRNADEQRQRREAEEAAELEKQRRLTVRDLFERWVSTQLQPRIRADGKRSGRKDGGQFVREQFERHVFPRIGAMTAADVRKSDLLALLDVQTSAGKMRTANMLLGDLKQLFDFAAGREITAGNPLGTTKKAKIGGASVERDRALSDDEVSALARALPAARMQPRSAAAIWLTLATGVRVGELMGAVWADDLPEAGRARQARLNALQVMADAEGVKLGFVDLTARTWYLPDTKNQRDHTIHLSDFAVAQLQKLAALREVLKDSGDGSLSPWVFPATDNSRPVCIKSFGKQLADRQRQPEQRMSGRSKATTALMLPGGKWTAHDLRRTAATIMARCGFSSDVINECLNHMQSDRMARVYIQDRREVDQARAFDALGGRLQTITSGEAATSSVINLRAA
jgi:integrase